MEGVAESLHKENEAVEKLSTEANLSYWNASISGKKEDYEIYEKKSIALQKHFNNKESFEKVRNFLGVAEKPLEKRQLEILYNAYLSCQGDIMLLEKITKKSTEIEHLFNTFRANLDGKELTENEIKEILKEETDVIKRERVWNAGKKQGEMVEKDLIELARLRNILAKSLGFKNYFEMSLETSEQKEDEIEKIFLELEKSTERSFKEAKGEIDEALAKSFGVDKSELKPWHYHDPFFQESPEIYQISLDGIYSRDILGISRLFYSELGFDINEILKNSDLYEKPGKNQHAYCINIERKGDVRVLENIKNNDGYHPP